METGTTRQDLTPLLNARSVAIVGISELPRFGGVVYENLRAFGYPGKIYGVNPKYRELNGMPCFPSLRELPERVDLAILALPNARLLDGLSEVGELGIPAAAIFASAHSAARESEPLLQAQLRQVACKHHIVICGPNCMGFHAFANRLVVSGYPITPRPSGNVAFITHSGSQFDALWQNRHGVNFNYLVSSGNEIATTLADYMQFVLNEPSTGSVGLFMETVRDPDTFVAALKTPAEKDIPIVALKVGQSERGAQLAQAHSGAFAGQDATYDALFRYYGVQRVKSPDEMLDTLELFAGVLRTPTKYISSVHDSGGERGLLVDLAAQVGLEFAPVSEATTERLSEILEPGLAPVNPVDAWGTGNDYDKIYRNCVLALDADPSTGVTVFAVDLYGSDSNLGYVDVAAGALSQMTKPLVFMTNLAVSADDAQMTRLRALGIPVLMGTENGVRALKHLVEYSEFQRGRNLDEGPLDELGAGSTKDERRRTNTPSVKFEAIAAAGGMLDEFQSKQILQGYGLTVPREALANSLQEALGTAERIGYPVALKTAAGELHKSDRGGVKLNLENGTQLTEAYAQLETTFGARVLVQEMVPRGVELILGIVNDPQFGAMLALGMGGIFVEVLNDTRLLMLPTTPNEVRDALLSLRGAKLLQGARGQAQVDVEAVVDAAMALSDIAGDYRDTIAAVDVNPLMALADRAVAVDALVIFKDSKNDD